MNIEKLNECVATAIGEASMCWSETPGGVFESTHASEIYQTLSAQILEFNATHRSTRVHELECRIVQLQLALEREIVRTRACVEAGIIAGIKEGARAAQEGRKNKC